MKTGGIGAEILANRLPNKDAPSGSGYGPMADCADCRYEEFFLSSWTVGDPAMNVDMPATNIRSDINSNRPGVRYAQAALFPDDPSNVRLDLEADIARWGGSTPGRGAR